MAQFRSYQSQWEKYFSSTEEGGFSQHIESLFSTNDYEFFQHVTKTGSYWLNKPSNAVITIICIRLTDVSKTLTMTRQAVTLLFWQIMSSFSLIGGNWMNKGALIFTMEDGFLINGLFFHQLIEYQMNSWLNLCQFIPKIPSILRPNHKRLFWC